MEFLEGPELFIAVAAVSLGVRVFGSGRWDRKRIRMDIETRGGRVETIRWTPFGRGWLGERNARIYQVEYVDGNGARQVRSCKTSWGAGVYWSEGDRL